VDTFLKPIRPRRHEPSKQRKSWPAEGHCLIDL
jgi:hypothetical protein